jgi:hypothetical protein
MSQGDGEVVSHLHWLLVVQLINLFNKKTLMMITPLLHSLFAEQSKCLASST